MSTTLALMPSVPAKSFDAATVTASVGTSFALLANASLVTWQTSFAVSPVAINIIIETSLDDSVWSTVATTTAIGGETDSFVTSALFIRASIVSHTGGTGATVNLVAKNAMLSTGQTLIGDVTAGQAVFGSATANTLEGNGAFSFIPGDTGTQYDVVAALTGPVFAIGADDVNGNGAILALGSNNDNANKPQINTYSSNGTNAVPVVNAVNNFLMTSAISGYDGSSFIPAFTIKYQVAGAVSAGVVPGRVTFQGTGPALTELVIDGQLGIVSIPQASTALRLGSAVAIQTDQTNAHTAVIQAYDVDGAAYKTFVTLTNGNTPDMTVSPPAGSTLVLQATTYKSSDGSTGATGSANNTNTLTIKNGLVTNIA